MYDSSNVAQFQADQAALVAALDQAHARAYHSYFCLLYTSDAADE